MSNIEGVRIIRTLIWWIGNIRYLDCRVGLSRYLWWVLYWDPYWSRQSLLVLLQWQIKNWINFSKSFATAENNLQAHGRRDKKILSEHLLGAMKLSCMRCAPSKQSCPCLFPVAVQMLSLLLLPLVAPAPWSVIQISPLVGQGQEEPRNILTKCIWSQNFEQFVWC